LNSNLFGPILLQLVLIALVAVFSCAESSVISINDTKLSKLSQQGDKRAQRLVYLTGHPTKFLNTMQTAVTVAGFLGSAFAADRFAGELTQLLTGLALPFSASVLHTISLVLITLLFAVLTLALGILAPKRLAVKKAESIALRLSGLISLCALLLTPLVWLLTLLTSGILRLFGVDPNESDENVTEEEIRMMLDAGSETGSIEKEEKELINNVFEFSDTAVEEIATHRTEIVVLWSEDPPETWDETIRSSRHSRYPICGESIDDVVGILNAKEYFRLPNNERETVLNNAVYPPYFVPESVRADVLLRNMKNTHNHLAVVLDEYGGMSGIITMNDLLGQLIGDELVDESRAPEERPDIIQLDDNTWDIRGTTDLDDISDALGILFPDNDHDTLSGLIFEALGLIPDDGTTLTLETAGLKIDVKEIRDHRVEYAIVQILPKSEEEAESET